MKHVVALASALFCAALASLTASAQTPLINHGDTWRWHKGSTPLQATWKTTSDAGLDGTWLTGAGGFGYSTDTLNETNQCRTILADMRNGYTTLYLRRQFQVNSPVSPTDHLLLTMDFDDGFIAWLDGNYLTNALVTGAPNEPAASATASATHESSRGASTPVNEPVTYDLGLVGSRLGVGTHTLAIIGLNQSSGSTDLIQIVDLAVGPPPTGTIATDTTWTAANSPYVVSNNIIVSGGAS